MRLDYADLYQQEFSCNSELRNTIEDYFPDHHLVFESEHEKSYSKYLWDNYIIILYYNQLYRIDIESRGNGGWLSIDECQVKSITKCKRVEKTVVVVDFESVK